MFTLTPKADDDMAGIWHYTYETWGITQADRYIDQLHRCFAGLADQRLVGSAYPQRLGYWQYLCQRHVIFFRKSDNTSIEIIRVLHERMDLPQHLTGED